MAGLPDSAESPAAAPPREVGPQKPRGCVALFFGVCASPAPGPAALQGAFFSTQIEVKARWRAVCVRTKSLPQSW